MFCNLNSFIKLSWSGSIIQMKEFDLALIFVWTTLIFEADNYTCLGHLNSG